MDHGCGIAAQYQPVAGVFDERRRTKETGQFLVCARHPARTADREREPVPLWAFGDDVLAV